MMDGTGNGSVASAAFNVHQHLSEATRLFHQNSYQVAAAAASGVSPFGGHMGSHPGHHHHHPGQHHQQNHPHSAAAAAAAVAAMNSQHGGMGQMSHGLTGSSQQIAAALFANSPLISDDLKLAAAAAAAAAAAQSARGKKMHRAEPVPQSGFKGVSWNSRMKAWLAFYVTENGERKSKTFSTRKLGMEEARLQAIAFCKQKQDQRREARKRNRELQSQHCGTGMDKLSSDESMMDSPDSGLGHLLPSGGPQGADGSSSSSTQSSLRCGYPTTPGMGMMSQSPTQSQSASNGSEIAYVPIVPIAMDMIEKSGLLQPLELNVLPPCQHCNKQPYPFLMIVSEGQEQTYSGSSIMSLASSHGQNSVPQSGESPDSGNPMNMDPSSPNTPISDQSSTPVPVNDRSRMGEVIKNIESNDIGYISCKLQTPNESEENEDAYNNLRHHHTSNSSALKRFGSDDDDDDDDESSNQQNFGDSQSSGPLLSMGDLHTAINHSVNQSISSSAGMLGEVLLLGDAVTGVQHPMPSDRILGDDGNDVMQNLRAYNDAPQLLGLDMERGDSSDMLASM